MERNGSTNSGFWRFDFYDRLGLECSLPELLICQCEEGSLGSQKMSSLLKGIRLPFQFRSHGQVRPRGSLGWALINPSCATEEPFPTPSCSLPRTWCELRLFLSHKPSLRVSTGFLC